MFYAYLFEMNHSFLVLAISILDIVGKNQRLDQHGSEHGYITAPSKQFPCVLPLEYLNLRCWIVGWWSE